MRACEGRGEQAGEGASHRSHLASCGRLAAPLPWTCSRAPRCPAPSGPRRAARRSAAQSRPQRGAAQRSARLPLVLAVGRAHAHEAAGALPAGEAAARRLREGGRGGGAEALLSTLPGSAAAGEPCLLPPLPFRCTRWPSAPARQPPPTCFTRSLLSVVFTSSRVLPVSGGIASPVYPRASKLVWGWGGRGWEGGREGGREGGGPQNRCSSCSRASQLAWG